MKRETWRTVGISSAIMGALFAFVGLYGLSNGQNAMNWLVAGVFMATFGILAAMGLVRPRHQLFGDGFRGERVCPHCAETIKSAARVCRYCGRDVEPVAEVDASEADSEPDGVFDPDALERATRAAMVSPKRTASGSPEAGDEFDSRWR